MFNKFSKWKYINPISKVYKTYLKRKDKFVCALSNDRHSLKVKTNNPLNLL